MTKPVADDLGAPKPFDKNAPISVGLHEVGDPTLVPVEPVPTIASPAVWPVEKIPADVSLPKGTVVRKSGSNQLIAAIPRGKQTVYVVGDVGEGWPELQARIEDFRYPVAAKARADAKEAKIVADKAETTKEHFWSAPEPRVLEPLPYPPESEFPESAP